MSVLSGATYPVPPASLRRIIDPCSCVDGPIRYGSPFLFVIASKPAFGGGRQALGHLVEAVERYGRFREYNPDTQGQVESRASIRLEALQVLAKVDNKRECGNCTANHEQIIASHHEKQKGCRTRSLAHLVDSGV